MTSVWPFRNFKCELIKSFKKKCEKTYYMWLSVVWFSNYSDLLKKNTQITSLMAAILNFIRKRGFPQGGFGWGFMGVFHGPTESNSVEKPLLTFLSIKKYLLPGLIGPVLTPEGDRTSTQPWGRVEIGPVLTPGADRTSTNPEVRLGQYSPRGWEIRPLLTTGSEGDKTTTHHGVGGRQDQYSPRDQVEIEPVLTLRLDWTSSHPRAGCR